MGVLRFAWADQRRVAPGAVTAPRYADPLGIRHGDLAVTGGRRVLQELAWIRCTDHERKRLRYGIRAAHPQPVSAPQAGERPPRPTTTHVSTGGRPERAPRREESATTPHARTIGVVTGTEPLSSAEIAVVQARSEAAASRRYAVRVVRATGGGPPRRLATPREWYGTVIVNHAGARRPSVGSARRVVVDTAPAHAGWLRQRSPLEVPDDAGAAQLVGRALAAQGPARVVVAAAGPEGDVAHRWTSAVRLRLGADGDVELAWSPDAAALPARLSRLLSVPATRAPTVVIAMSDETAAHVRAVVADAEEAPRTTVATRTSRPTPDDPPGSWWLPVPAAGMATAALALLEQDGRCPHERPSACVVRVPFALTDVALTLGGLADRR